MTISKRSLLRKIASTIFIASVIAQQSGCNKVTPTNASGENPESEAVGMPSLNNAQTKAPPIQVERDDLLASSDTAPGQGIEEFSPPIESAVRPPSDGELIQPPVVVNESGVPTQASAPELENQSFATILPSTSDAPAVLIEHIRDVDAALENLVIFGQRNLIDEDIFIEGGMRLGKMKLLAAEKIIASSNATPEELKVGKVAKLVALSHLGGLQDVDAAQKLNEFAKELSQSDDKDLEHQGRVVLLGFEVQSLQNGLTVEPTNLVVACEQLLKAPELRNFPELMAVQNAASVMHQMGFADATFATLDLIAQAYQDSPTKALRERSWAFAVGSRPVAQKFYAAMKALDSGDGSAETVATAAQALIAAHPLNTTVEQLALTIGNIEAAGYADASNRIATIVADAVNTREMAEFHRLDIQELLDAHAKRKALVGQPFSPPDALTFAGDRFDQAPLAGKVVLVVFWSSEVIAARQELAQIANEYERLSAKGFEVVGMSLDLDLSRAQQFLSESNFPWINLRPADASRVGGNATYSKAFGASQTPFSFLVGKDGTIKKLHVRSGNLATEVEDLL